jgi:acyl carrier protein
MEFEQRLTEIVRNEAELAGGDATSLDANTRLIDTGLDSLGFTTLMVKMEQEFGLDPFGAADEIVYPETFGELVGLYRQAAGGI